MNRIETLRIILDQNPADKLARYGLAMEYVKAGEYEAAIGEFETLLATAPDYLYAYYHAGQVLEKLGRIEDARAMYQRGIEAAETAGDRHAQSELSAALAQLR